MFQIAKCPIIPFNTFTLLPLDVARPPCNNCLCDILRHICHQLTTETVFDNSGTEPRAQSFSLVDPWWLDQRGAILSQMIKPLNIICTISVHFFSVKIVALCTPGKAVGGLRPWLVSTSYRPPEQIPGLVIPNSHPRTYGRILYEMPITFKCFTISLILDTSSCTYPWQWGSWCCQKFQSLWYCYLPFVSKWDLTAVLQSSDLVAKVLGSYLRQHSVGCEAGHARVEILLFARMLF